MEALRRLGAWMTELLFPQGNLCCLCRRPMLRADEPALCEKCAQKLEEARIHEHHLCSQDGGSIACAVASYRYEGAARELVHTLKFKAARIAALPLAHAMACALVMAEEEGPRRADVVIPIPMHQKRRRMRGYNQAEELARELAFHLDRPMDTASVIRARYTSPQVGKKRAQRLRSMQDAFAVADESAIADKRVLLVDDVCTTSATASACAKSLLQAGAQEVCLVTACRA